MENNLNVLEFEQQIAELDKTLENAEKAAARENRRDAVNEVHQMREERDTLLYRFFEVSLNGQQVTARAVYLGRPTIQSQRHIEFLPGALEISLDDFLDIRRGYVRVREVRRETKRGSCGVTSHGRVLPEI